MKKIMLIVATVLTAGTLSAQIQLPEGYQYENYVQVNGRAEKEVTPDEIYINIVISENDTKGKVSIAKMEDDMVARLQAMGIDVEKDLKVGDMQSDFKEYRLRRNDTRTTTTYQLKVSSAATMSRVYEQLGAMGISNLTVARVSHSRMSELQNETRVEAVRNARQIAQSLAEAVGQEIGRAVLIVDYNNDGVVMYRQMAVADQMYAGGAESQPTIDFRNIKITCTVNTKFELK